MEEILAVDQNELRQLLASSEKFFDRIRLVDPMKMCVVTLTEQGNILDTDEQCYDVWGQDAKCANCCSMCALHQKCTVSKNEKLGRDSYHIVARAVELKQADGTERKLVIEWIGRTLEEDEMKGKKQATTKNTPHFPTCQKKSPFLFV